MSDNQQKFGTNLTQRQRIDYAVIVLGLYTFGNGPDWSPDGGISYQDALKRHEIDLSCAMDNAGVPFHDLDPKWIAYKESDQFVDHENRRSKIISENTPQEKDQLIGLPQEIPSVEVILESHKQIEQLETKLKNSSFSGAHLPITPDLPPVTEKDLDDQKGIFESDNPVEPPMSLEMRLEVAKQIANLNVEVPLEKPLEEMTPEEKAAHKAALYKKLDELGVPAYRSEIYQYGLRQHLEQQPTLDVSNNIFDLLRGSSRLGQVLTRKTRQSRKKKRK